MTMASSTRWSPAQGAPRLMGLLMEHPDGGPSFALRRDPERARAAAGFDDFSIGVPDKKSIELLAARLTDLGEEHAGVHVATIGWLLPMLHDPDGHEVRFYTVQHHTRPDVDAVLVIEDPVGTEAQRERDAGRWPVNDVGAQPAARSRTWTWLGSLDRLPSALRGFGWRSPGRW